MAIFTLHLAKTNLSKLIADALNGNDVVITRNKQPLVRLVPVESVKPRRPGALKGKISLTPACFARGRTGWLDRRLLIMLPDTHAAIPR